MISARWQTFGSETSKTYISCWLPSSAWLEARARARWTTPPCLRRARLYPRANGSNTRQSHSLPAIWCNVSQDANFIRITELILGKRNGCDRKTFQFSSFEGAMPSTLNPMYAKRLTWCISKTLMSVKLRKVFSFVLRMQSKLKFWICCALLSVKYIKGGCWRPVGEEKAAAAEINPAARYARMNYL